MAEKPDKEFVIFVNKKQIKIVRDELSGKEILELAGFNSNEYDLYLIHGQESELISSDGTVEIRNGLHFNAIIRSAPYG